MGAESPLTGYCALMRLGTRKNLGELAEPLLARARTAADPNALMDLSMIFQMVGTDEQARSAQEMALKLRRVFHLPVQGGRAAIRLLVILLTGEYLKNTPVEFLFEGSDVALELLFVGPNHPLPASLPEHDLLFTAVFHTDENRALLEDLDRRVAHGPRPIVNRPANIAALSRTHVCAQLSSLPGTVMSMATRIGREELSRLTTGFPIIVRPIDTQGGRGLAKTDGPQAIADHLRALPDAREFFIAPFIDYLSADGLYRKYRIALIDGQAYACHMAISENWMVHYWSAGMEKSADKRAEEERFLTGFAEEFGRRHAAALGAINERLGLEYLVMDCSESCAGELLIFEVDNAGYVHATDPIDVFPYKQAPMRKVFAAVRDLLRKKLAR